MRSIVTITLNPAIDRSSTVAQVTPERKLRCTPPRLDPGGGGLNVARVLARLGADPLALWSRGGTTGALLGELLDEEGVRHRPIEISGRTRENLIVLEGATGRQFRFNFPGTELEEPDLESWLRATEELREDSNVAWLVLSGSLPPGAPGDLYDRIARLAPSSARVILDTSGEALARGARGGVWLIKPNLRELGELAGREIESDEEIDRASRQLIADGRTECVLTSLGSGGLVLVTRETCERIRAPTVPIRSKVGAGDSTVAGLVFALALGRSLSDAVRYAVAAGAAAVSTEGTRLCERAGVERLYEQSRDSGEQDSSPAAGANDPKH